MPEVTDEEIAASRMREQKIAINGRIATLERTIDELAENLRTQREVLGSLQQDLGQSNVAVGVTQGPVIIREYPRPPYRGLYPDNLPHPPSPPHVAVPRVNPPRMRRAG